jgi:hypothetical protein
VFLSEMKQTGNRFPRCLFSMTTQPRFRLVSRQVFGTHRKQINGRHLVIVRRGSDFCLCDLLCVADGSIFSPELLPTTRLQDFVCSKYFDCKLKERSVLHPKWRKDDHTKIKSSQDISNFFSSAASQLRLAAFPVSFKDVLTWILTTRKKRKGLQMILSSSLSLLDSHPPSPPPPSFLSHVNVDSPALFCLSLFPPLSIASTQGRQAR